MCVCCTMPCGNHCRLGHTHLCLILWQGSSVVPSPCLHAHFCACSERPLLHVYVHMANKLKKITSLSTQTKLGVCSTAGPPPPPHAVCNLEVSSYKGVEWCWLSRCQTSGCCCQPLPKADAPWIQIIGDHMHACMGLEPACWVGWASCWSFNAAWPRCLATRGLRCSAVSTAPHPAPRSDEISVRQPTAHMPLTCPYRRGCRLGVTPPACLRLLARHLFMYKCSKTPPCWPHMLL